MYMSYFGDWLSNPKQFVESIYKAHDNTSGYKTDCTSVCLKGLKSLLTEESIPSVQYINSVSFETITPNTIMCFRGMPTSKMPTEESTVDAGENVAKCPFLFQQSANLPADDCLNDSFDSDKTSLRCMYRCESIVSQTKWVKAVTYPCDCSRYSEPVNVKSPDLCQCKKRINCCLLKVYDDEDNRKIKLDLSYDFFGIVEIDDVTTDGKESSTFKTVTLHCITVIKLQHINPYLPTCKSLSVKTAESLLSSKILNVLKDFLNSVTLGDQLLADYLLCFLLDKVGDGEETFCFNISGISSKEYSRFLLKSLKFILTLVKRIESSHEGLKRLGNTQATYDSDGQLHLHDFNVGQNCLLFIDDMEARKGILKGATLKGFCYLSDFIMSQQMYNTGTRQCSVLIISNTPSQLANCFQIPFVPQKPIPTNFSSYYRSITAVNNIPLLRAFITAVKNFKFFFHQQIIQTVYGNTDNYHSTNIKMWKALNFMSQTEKDSINLWKKILEMEECRKMRLVGC